MKRHIRLDIGLYFSLLTSLLFSCQDSKTSFTAEQSQIVRDSVLKLADQTANDISSQGPIAWLDHFEDSPDFFMASDGSLAFKNYAVANSFIKDTLIKVMPKLTLKWSAIRIDPLTSEIAVMAAGFHEDASNSAGKTMPFDGYFTATVHKTDKGWKYRNAHWSLKHAK